MMILDIIPLTKIPRTQPQILSYFFSADLPIGTIIKIPLGRRKETGIVFDSHRAADLKMEIKKAGYELRPISKVISAEPVLTRQQIELALWLGQYYFASPGLFLKMMMPRLRQGFDGRDKKIISSNVLNRAKSDQGSYANKKPKQKKLIITPTIALAEKIAKQHPDALIWHSELTKKQQNEIWWQVKNGQAQTTIGTRSAVFLPFVNLKEIIIKDETNPAHRSWDMFPHYRTHEAAKKLSEFFKATLSIKSEVPSVELTYQQSLRTPPAETKPAYRTDGQSPNAFSDSHRNTFIVDMRAELREGNFSIFSRDLQGGIKQALIAKKQILLFINRRGAANFVLCRDCGYVAKCRNCDAPLAYHLIADRPILLCHRCGHKEIPPDLCPKCQSHRIKTVGTGTQKVELEAQKLHSQAKILRLDSDTAPNVKAQQKIIDIFIKKEADILIATQIIFSWLQELKLAQPAVVALISADTLLYLPDYHSGERTFQTITALKQFSCHCGNLNTQQSKPYSQCEIINSLFFIQTYNPKSTVIKYAAASDWDSFYQEEIEARRLLGYPPFSQIVKLTFRHRDLNKTSREAKNLAAKLKNVIARSKATKQLQINNATRGTAAVADNDPETADIEISDALPSFIPKEKGRYTWNIIIKFKIKDSRFDISNKFLRIRNSLLQYVPLNWEIDVDPVGLL